MKPEDIYQNINETKDIYLNINQTGRYVAKF